MALKEPRSVMYKDAATGKTCFAEYVMLSDSYCVFTGITSGAGPTIFSAPDIIKNIARIEMGGRIKGLEFYDLQTHVIHGYLGPNEYAFDKVVWIPNGDAEDAQYDRSVECPIEALDIFRHHIGWKPDFIRR